MTKQNTTKQNATEQNATKQLEQAIKASKQSNQATWANNSTRQLTAILAIALTVALTAIPAATLAPHLN